MKFDLIDIVAFVLMICVTVFAYIWKTGFQFTLTSPFSNLEMVALAIIVSSIWFGWFLWPRKKKD